MTPAARMFSGSIGKTDPRADLLPGPADEGVLSLDDHLADHLGDEPWLDRLPNARTSPSANSPVTRAASPSMSGCPNSPPPSRPNQWCTASRPNWSPSCWTPTPLPRR